MYAKAFETENLIIRPSIWEDLEDFFEWERRPEVTEFLSWGRGNSAFQSRDERPYLYAIVLHKVSKYDIINL